MSNQMNPEDRLPRRPRNENLRRETARDETFAGGEPTRAFDQTPAAYPGQDYAPAAEVPVTDAPVLDPRLIDPRLTDRQTAVAREKEQFGGIKVGSAFFGWLAATGMAVLLTAFVAAAGTAVGLANNTDVNAAVNHAAPPDPECLRMRIISSCGARRR